MRYNPSRETKAQKGRREGDARKREKKEITCGERGEEKLERRIRAASTEREKERESERKSERDGRKKREKKRGRRRELAAAGRVRRRTF